MLSYCNQPTKNTKVAIFILCIMTIIPFIGFISLSPTRGKEIIYDVYSSVSSPTQCNNMTNFVCPQEVLNKRNANYNNNGKWSNFHKSQFYESEFIYSEFFHHNNSWQGSSFTFIEIGGYNGLDGSNSYFFEYVLGWKGVIIEASTLNYIELEKNRNNSGLVSTIHAAVCRIPSILAIYGGNSLTSNIKKDPTWISNLYRSVCPCFKMDDILNMVDQSNYLPRKMNKIDYFSLDVEGEELSVIETHDWEKRPIFVLSIETAISGLSGTKEDQDNKRCALFKRNMCRWPFYDDYRPDIQKDHPFSKNNEIWINPLMLRNKP